MPWTSASGAWSKKPRRSATVLLIQGFRVRASGFRFWGLGFRVRASGFRVWG